MTKSPNFPLDHPLISQRYFFPRRTAFPDPFWVDVPKARLACRYHRPHPGANTVIFFHGNGEIVEDYFDNLLPALERMGVNCLLAEYRGYGMSTGHPELAGMLEDVEPIVRAAEVSPEKIVFYGRSLGSIYAVHGVSLFPRAAGLILESAIADFLDRLLMRIQPEEVNSTMEELAEAVKERLDAREKLARFQGASIVLHTRHDGLIHLSHAERLHQWLPEPKKLVIFDEGDHNSILYLNWTEYCREVTSFLAALPREKV